MLIRKQTIRDCIEHESAAALRTPKALVAAALALGMGAMPLTGVAAEDAERPYSSEQTGAQSSDRGDMSPGLLTSDADDKLPQGMKKASKLIGYSVRDARGEEIGEIKDLALDTSQGRVVYAVVAAGGVMGVGGQLHAVPLDSFDMHAQDDALILNATEQQLSSAQDFDDDNWPLSPTWQSEGGSSGAGMDGTSPTASAASIVKASEYLDKDVKGMNDEDVGDISDLAINMETGEIVYAVMERGGTLGVGDRLIAIPTDALSPGADDDELRISATEEQLQNAQGFTDENWPERAEFAQFETDKQDSEGQSPSVQDPTQPQTNR